MNIAIIGAGWYGCHIATTMMQQGHDVKIYEAGTSVFSGASRKNQNRLHMGYHYPRDFSTRDQSLEGYSWFKEHYPSFIEEVKNNYYAVSSKNSLLDYETYKQIMSASNLKYRCIENPCVNINGVSGIISVDEMLVRNDKAANYFSKTLSPYIKYNFKINLFNKEILKKLMDEFDYIINCTWFSTGDSGDYPIFFEPCIYFYYDKIIDEEFSLTIMDGPFYSLYPYIEKKYTLTSVLDTPIDKLDTYDEASNCISGCNTASFINQKRNSFEEGMKFFMPNFQNSFKYSGYEFSIKTKLVSSTDFRGSMLKQDGKLISVFSGKIDTIHIIDDLLKEIIK